MAVPERKWQRAIVPLLLGVSLVVLLISPIGWKCPIYGALHVPCPTCGMTRAVRMLLWRDFAGATAMHPLVWIVMPILIGFLGVELFGYARSGTWGAGLRIPYARQILVGLALLLFVVWIARFYGAFGGPVG